MKHLITIAIAAGCIAAANPAQATGKATCNSGAQSGWQSEDTLKRKLIAQGWFVRRIKIDGGCYEVYGINENGKRVETYFHPVTLDHVLTTAR